jgi:hypothetical protein
VTDWIHASCEAMYRDPTAGTAPLDEFLEEMDADDNVWWMIGSGHHLNLFEEAVEQLERLRQWRTEIMAFIQEVAIGMSPDQSETLASLREQAGNPS